MPTNRTVFPTTHVAALSVFSLLIVCADARGAISISPSPSYNGSYTITWGPTGCQSTGYPYPYPPQICYYLYEGQTGVSQSSPVHVSGKADGTYTYTVVADYLYYQETVGSASVIVGTPPPRDPLLTQLDYQYQVRAGDYQGNGATDLFVKRVSGGVSGNGVLDELMLWQSPSTGEFVPVVPSPSLSTLMSGWPLSSASAVVADVNVDGYVDVALKGVASATGTAADNQIIYSSGTPLDPQPLGLRAVDSSLKQYVGNSLDYFVNPDYFVDNSTVIYFSGSYTYISCYFGGPSYGVLDDPYFGYSFFTTCQVSYVPIYGNYVDFSDFAAEAVGAWMSEEEFGSGTASATESTEAVQEGAEGVLEVEIGGWPMEEVFGSNGEHTDPDVRRGIENFLAVLRIGQVYADEIETEEAPSQVDTGSQRCIELRSRRVGGLGPLAHHASLAYASGIPVRWFGAFDNDERPLFDGLLVGQRQGEPLAASDDPRFTMFVSFVDPPFQVPGVPCADPPALAYWAALLVAEDAYADNLPYDKNGNEGPNGYNSNGFVRGILEATGGTVREIGTFDRLWGWNNPVPPASFQ